MSKALACLSLALLAASLCARTAPAQTTPEWIVLSPAGEGFTARMPAEPTLTEQRVRANGLDASGLRYAADADDATTFVIWSMKGSHDGGQLGGGDRAARATYGVFPYLDKAAELAWELVAPEIKRLEKKGVKWWRRSAKGAEMIYVRDFKVSGFPAREYSVIRGRAGGRVYVCSEGAQVYVVAALGADVDEALLRRFADSFALKSAPPPAPPKVGEGNAIGPGRGRAFGGRGGAAVPVDYSRPFRQSEVTKKAVITHQPEAGFTDQARKFNVIGVVRLHAVLHSSGETQVIVVAKALPHGLTQKSVDAAKRIRFTPAQKDGRLVSQYAVLEYKFNIY